MEDLGFGFLLGKIIVKIEGAEKNSEEILFTLADGQQYKLSHFQDCCESVYVEDVCGDITDLIGLPLGLAECISNQTQKSQTWTFYKLATNRGAVTIRWYGTSNGYYSTSVDFVKV